MPLAILEYRLIIALQIYFMEDHGHGGHPDLLHLATLLGQLAR